jgi:Nucleoside diphosphate kinase
MLTAVRCFRLLTNSFNRGRHYREGKDIIHQGRQMLGETQPLASKPGSIRGDFSIDLGRNICKSVLLRGCNISIGTSISPFVTLLLVKVTGVTRLRVLSMSSKCGSQRV